MEVPGGPGEGLPGVSRAQGPIEVLPTGSGVRCSKGVLLGWSGDGGSGGRWLGENGKMGTGALPWGSRGAPLGVSGGLSSWGASRGGTRVSGPEVASPGGSGASVTGVAWPTGSEMLMGSGVALPEGIFMGPRGSGSVLQGAHGTAVRGSPGATRPEGHRARGAGVPPSWSLSRKRRSSGVMLVRSAPCCSRSSCRGRRCAAETRAPRMAALPPRRSPPPI